MGQAFQPALRRLVSEGTRLRLPWGSRLPQFIADPSPVFQLLEKLKDDPSEYVRRSVANNLNDISKDRPDAVIALCRRWRKVPTPGKLWIIRHAIRTYHPGEYAVEILVNGKPLGRVAFMLSIP